jgi:hypothetical protein
MTPTSTGTGTPSHNYFESVQIERLHDLVLMLTAELNVANQRIRTMEMLLNQRGHLDEGEVDAFRPDAAQQATLDSVRDDLLNRWVQVVTESPEFADPLRHQWVSALGRADASQPPGE